MFFIVGYFYVCVCVCVSVQHSLKVWEVRISTFGKRPCLEGLFFSLYEPLWLSALMAVCKATITLSGCGQHCREGRVSSQCLMDGWMDGQTDGCILRKNIPSWVELGESSHSLFSIPSLVSAAWTVIPSSIPTELPQEFTQGTWHDPDVSPVYKYFLNGVIMGYLTVFIFVPFSFPSPLTETRHI